MFRSIIVAAALLSAVCAGTGAQARASGPGCLPPAVSHALIAAAGCEHMTFPANWAHQRLQVGRSTISYGVFTNAMGRQMDTSQYQVLARMIDR